MSAFPSMAHKTITGILSVFYFSRCSPIAQAKKANHLKSRAPTRCIIRFGSRTGIVCLLHIFCDNKEQKRQCRREYKDGERVLTALNQDAMSGPHVFVDLEC